MDGVKCSCGVAASRGITQKEGANKGRHFFSCAQRKCGFFKWTCEVVLPDPAPVKSDPRPVLVTPQPVDANTNLEITKLQWRVAVLENIVKEIGAACKLPYTDSK